jgi:hypothetical protein
MTSSLCFEQTVYVAFLDSRKAFDTEWYNTLMFKLFNVCVKGKTWFCINELHSNAHSDVIVLFFRALGKMLHFFLLLRSILL